VTPSLTIAIPTLHNFEQLGAALKSLIVYTDYPYKMVIVNNCPADDEVLEQKIKESDLGDLVSVINMGFNSGWMKAINRVLEDCDTEFFCCMNDDVVFIPGSTFFWRTLIAHFRDPEVAITVPSSNFVAGVQNLFNMDVPIVCETGLAIGMLAVHRTEEFKMIGGLDDTLPGGDDLDISIRYLQRGKKIICDRSSYVHHIGQQTGRRVEGDDWDSQAHQERTNNALIRKHGVLAWYSTFVAGWKHSDSSSEYLDKKSEEDWLGERLARYMGTGNVGVDLGCGPGIDGLDNLKLIKLDMAKKGDRGVGGRKFNDASPDLTADAVDIPAKDSSVDFVLARHLFEHLVDPIGALEEWKRVLKPGGELLISVPDHAKVPSMILDSSHVHAYTPESLVRLLNANQWVVDKCESVGWGVVVCSAKL
jgi:GT2 family glycosyltransferase